MRGVYTVARWTGGGGGTFPGAGSMAAFCYANAQAAGCRGSVQPGLV